MNRQYIGARYVPKFYEGSNGNEWDVNVPYEPLTIVTYLGNSYTSKVPVPANVGAPNLNPTYWVLTSNYSAQIEEYRQTVEEYKGDVDNLERDFNDLVDRVDVIDYYTNKSILILGDSISDTGIERFQPNWVTHFITKVTASGGTVTNYSAGGRTLSDIDPDNDLIDALAGVPAGDYTDIIVFVGINDWALQATPSQIGTALNSLETWFINTYPNAKVHFITPLKTKVDYGGAKNCVLMWYRMMIVKHAEKFGWNVIDAYVNAPLFNGNNGSLANLWSGDNLGVHDGLHINPDYAPYFADYVYRNLPTYSSAQECLLVENKVFENFFNSKNLNVYIHGDGTIVLYIDLDSYTPSNILTELGTLQEWYRPILDKSFRCYCSGTSFVDFIVRSDGKLYMLAPDTNNLPDCRLTAEYYCNGGERPII